LLAAYVAVRRLGYLCDRLGIDIDLPAVKTRNYLLLDQTIPNRGLKNRLKKCKMEAGHKS